MISGIVDRVSIAFCSLEPEGCGTDRYGAQVHML